MNLRFIKNNTPKVWSWGRAEGVKGAIGKPPCRLRRGETPATQSRNPLRKTTIRISKGDAPHSAAPFLYLHHPRGDPLHKHPVVFHQQHRRLILPNQRFQLHPAEHVDVVQRLIPHKHMRRLT